MPWDGLSTQFLDGIRQSRRIQFAADIMQGATVLLANLPISSGSMRYDSSSDVRRAGSFICSDPAFRPWVASDLLAPFGNSAQLKAGVHFGNGTVEWCPLMNGRLETNSFTLTSNGVTVNLNDGVAQVKDTPFDDAVLAHAGLTIAAEIGRLIVDAVPAAVVLEQTGSTIQMPAPASQVYEGDRWAIIVALAKSIAAEVICDPVGRYVIRPVPTLASTPSFTFDAGPYGVLVDGTRAMTRQGVFNKVIVQGDQGGAAGPIQSIAVDTGATSPTRYGGPFGKVSRTLVLSTISTQAQADAAAAAELAKTVGPAFSVDFTAFPHYGLDGGDVVLIQYPLTYITRQPGPLERHIIDTFQIDLGVAAMSATTRSSNPGPT